MTDKIIRLTNDDDYFDFGNGKDGVIRGLDGDDTIVGGNGKDNIKGNKGDDVLEGGNGADFLFGGKGDDTLTGGNGPDTFAFIEANRKGDGDDTITDFSSTDTIDVSKLGVTEADITFYGDLAGIDTNGDGTFDLTVTTTGYTLSADDFLF